MATRRIMGWSRVSYYHVVSRVVDRRFIFGDVEKRFFRATLEKLMGFTGVRCVTYCLMGNHFHLLLEIPEGEAYWRERGGVDDGEVVRRLRFLYGRGEVSRVCGLLKLLRETSPASADALVGSYVRRMYDLSEFVKELKWRFSRWYNGRAGRVGTLWERPFHSVLVEPGRALLATAAYIDLNPVRAGMVSDPKDYRWCGYGEALAGNASFRMGVATVVRWLAGGRDARTWRAAHRWYRTVLFETGVGGALEAGGRSGAGYDKGAGKEGLRGGGRLSSVEVLRCRVRYFTAGWAIGTREFLEEVFAKNRERFGARRRDGARPMRYADWGELAALRDLRRGVVTPPPPDGDG